MVRQVEHLLKESSLGKKISSTLRKTALEFWGPEKVSKAMEQAFGKG